MSAKRFTLFVLAGVVGFLVAIALFNAVVDPYGIYRWVDINGFNHDKTQAIDQSRMAKTYLVERADPTTLLVGSSRVDLGFDPRSPVWPPRLQPVFNLGLPGSGPTEQLRSLQDALTVTHPKLVVLGVGFDDAHLPPKKRLMPVASAEQRRILTEFDARMRVAEDGSPNPRYQLARMRDTVSTLLSLNALGDSAMTLLAQGSGRARVTSRGFNTGTNFLDLVRTQGEFSLFADKNQVKAQELMHWVREPRVEVEPLARAIALARQRKADVIVAILPSHVDGLELLVQAQAFDLFDQWRRQVAAIVFEAAQGGHVVLWDFTSVTRFISERPPAPGDRTTQLRWFWEIDHFKPALGDLIISRILGNGPGDFGKLVTPDNLAELESEQKMELTDFAKQQPENVDRVARVYGMTLEMACKSDSAFCRPRDAKSAHIPAADPSAISPMAASANP